jgi:glycosyltransferase involved in cell wall biosynthesis
MRIAMFSNTYHPIVGGIEKSIDIFSTEMRRQGHRVLIVAPEYEGAKESTENVLRVPAIKQFAGTPYSFMVSIPLVISSQLREFKPDIIHSHQPFLLGDSALRLSRELHVPLIYTNHTFMERYLHWFPIDWQILRDIAEKLPVAYANLTDHVVTPTSSVAQILRLRGTITPITSIPTGIDANFFASGNRARFRTQHGLDESHLVIGHLGRLNPEKNLEYLAQAALRFVQKAPQQRRFLVAGEGESVPHMLQLFSDHGATDQLVYTGLVKGQTCADAYAAMDAFIFASLTDTQGLVLTEAMAAGNPVFAIDAPGVRDMIEHERNGYLFSHNTSTAEFADRLDKLLCNTALYAQLKSAATADAQNVSIPHCTHAMLELYQTVIDSTHSNPGELSKWEKLVNRWETEIDLIQEKLETLSS